MNNFDTITIKHTNAGNEVWLDNQYCPQISINDAINMAHFLNMKEEQVTVTFDNWIRIFNK